MVQFGFTHHPRQPKEQAVMVLMGVIDKLGIRNECAKERT
jgi:hypothetical protein